MSENIKVIPCDLEGSAIISWDGDLTGDKELQVNIGCNKSKSPRSFDFSITDGNTAKAVKILQEANFVETKLLSNEWISHLNLVKDKVISNRSLLGSHHVEFLYFTDCHWSQNLKNSPLIVSWLKKELGNIPLIFGGDIIGTPTSNGSKFDRSTGAILILEFMAAFNYNIFGTLGNHEFNDDSAASSQLIKNIDYNDIYELYLKYNLKFPNSHNITELDSSFLLWEGDYFDDVTHNVRFIHVNTSIYPRNSLNTTISRAKKALNTMLLNLPLGYKAIVVTHNPSGSTLWDFASNYTYCSNIQNLDLMLLGHIHNLVPEKVTVLDHTLWKFMGKCDKSVDISDALKQCVYVILADFTNKVIYVTRAGIEWRKYYTDKERPAYDSAITLKY